MTRTRRWVAGWVAGLALLTVAPVGAVAQHSSDPGQWRFPVGERAEYDVTFGPVKVGKGSLAVEAIDTIAGTPAYRVAFEIRGGAFFYRIDDRSVSWVAPRPIRSLRFEQRLREGGYRRHRRYELDQTASVFTREDWDAAHLGYRPNPDWSGVPMPAGALDEIAYVFLAREVPLEPGRTYYFDRYFQADGNPVVLKMLRRETVRVPAGRFRTVVVQPIIHAGGMFGRGGEAELYITNDERRIIVLLKAHMSAGDLAMYLREYEPGAPDGYITAPDGSMDHQPAEDEPGRREAAAVTTR